MDRNSDKLIPVLVYGTLMKGERAHSLMGDAPCEGNFLLRDYAMYHLGRYPGIVPHPGENVVGEVYWVDRRALENMDEYEGEGSLYHRRTVTVERGSCRLSAEVYVYARSVEGCPLLSAGKAPAGVGVEGYRANWKQAR